MNIKLWPLWLTDETWSGAGERWWYWRRPFWFGRQMPFAFATEFRPLIRWWYRKKEERW